MQAIRIHTRLRSQQLDLPELAPLVGRDVDIIVLFSDEAIPPTERPARRAGSGKGTIRTSDDFDAPLTTLPNTGRDHPARRALSANAV